MSDPAVQELVDAMEDDVTTGRLSAAAAAERLLAAFDRRDVPER